MSDALVLARVTEEFLNKVLKEYTRRAEEIESRKNGVRKNRVTKAFICKIIINDMQTKGLIQ